MTAVSAPQAANGFVPPNSLHAEQELWEQTLSNGHQPIHRQALPNSPSDPPIPAELAQTGDQSFAHTTYTNSSPPTSKPSEPWQKQVEEVNHRLNHAPVTAPDSTYLTPARADALGRKEGNISQTGSEADSLLELYRQHSASRSGSNSMDRGEQQGVTAADEVDFEDEDPERSRWIHRDKLAKIESQELRQAGYQLPPQFRAVTRSSELRERDMEGKNNAISEESSAHQHGERVDKRQRLIISPSPELEADDDEGVVSFDLRTPEEIAANPYEEDHSPQTVRHGGYKPGSSKIPLSKTSPSPIPQDYIERNTPLPRKRGYSGGWSGGDEDGLMYKQPRSRSHSIGSQVLLDEHLNGTPTPASRPASRSMAQPALSKAKAPTKPAPVSSARKTSTTNRNTSGQHNARTASGVKGSSPGQRPGTRPNEARPATAINRPEGDPPWLASMYKPDPRLPPEQQLLPTHAKRLQQEQWEKEGKSGSVFDKEFAPLAVHTHNGLQPPQAPTHEAQAEPKSDEPQPWRLSATAVSSNVADGRPGTAGTDRGGYSTMPKVQDSTTPSGSVQAGQRAQQPSRLQPLPQDEGEKKGGCGCCVVM